MVSRSGAVRGQSPSTALLPGGKPAALPGRIVFEPKAPEEGRFGWRVFAAPADRQHADHRIGADVALLERMRIELRRRRPRNARPERAVAKVVAQAPAEERPERRTHAERIDDKIERSRLPAVRADKDLLPPGAALDAFDPPPGLDRDAGGLHGVKENIEERRAMDAEPETVSPKSPVTDVEHDPLGRKHAAEEAIEAAAERKHALGEPKLGEHGEPGRLQDQPGAERARRLELLEDRDAMALPRQEERRGKPGRPRARDPDRKSLHLRPHRTRPS